MEVALRCSAQYTGKPVRLRGGRAPAVPDRSSSHVVHDVDHSASVEPADERAREAAAFAKVAVAPPADQGLPRAEGDGFGARIGNGLMSGAVVFVGATFLVSIYRYCVSYNKAESRARRKMLNNKAVVSELASLLPDQREEATPGRLRRLGLRTRFSATEIFRKWLWYVLRERKFDEEALKDILHVKDALKLSNEDVARALRVRCERIEKKYGNLMLSTEGLSQKGLQRKATCRALFSKMLYLIENEDVLTQNDTMSVRVLRDIFGATEDDVAHLRIVSLHEVDMDALNAMVTGDSEDRV